MQGFYPKQVPTPLFPVLDKSCYVSLHCVYIVIYIVYGTVHHLLVTQALKEPMYSAAYANLCRVMSPVSPASTPQQDNALSLLPSLSLQIKVSWITEDGKEQSTTFRREVLTMCQREFEGSKQDKEKEDQLLRAVKEAQLVCLACA